jgi:hypothetical protein
MMTRSLSWSGNEKDFSYAAGCVNLSLHLSLGTSHKTANWTNPIMIDSWNRYFKSPRANLA